MDEHVDLAGQFGAERALSTANRNLTDGQLASIAPLLQMVTLPQSTRELVSRAVLTEPRDALTMLIPTADAEPLQLRRFSPKTLFTVTMLLIAVFLVLGSLNFEEVVASFREANPWWLVAAFVAGISTFFGAALGLVAFTPEKIGMLKIDSPAFLGFTPATKQFLPLAYSWHFSVWNWPVLPVIPWVMTLVSLLIKIDMFYSPGLT